MSDGSAKQWGKATREVLLVAALFVLFAALTLPMFVTSESRSLTASDGAIAIPSELLRERPVVLQGEWRVERLGRDGAVPATAPVAVPGRWIGTPLADGSQLGESAAVLYRLTLRDLAAGDYRLFVPPVYAGTRVYIDGRLRSQRGSVGFGPEESRYEVQSHDISFEAAGGDIDIAIAISTFHDQANGMRLAPLVGEAAPMSRWLALAWARTFYVGAAFVLIGLFALIVYFNRRADKSPLLLALGAFGLLGIQVTFGHSNVLLLALPALPYVAMMTITKVSAYTGLIAWVAYVEALFPDPGRRRIYWLLIATIAAVGLGGLAVMAVGGTLPGSRSVIGSVICLTLAALFIFVRSLRALRKRLDGALLFFGGQAAVVASLAMQATVNVNYVAPGPIGRIDFAAYALLIFAFTHLVILARRWTVAIASAEALSDDLGRLLEVNSAVASDLQLGSLLDKIVTVTGKIIRAGRVTLFLKEKDRPVLASQVAQGVDEEPIRFDVGRGLAGYVFATGENLSVPDAYADERFNRSIDEATGFRTKSVLAVPISTRDGRRLGVMEALNREDGGAFTAGDAARMSAFGAQAAVAIDNARLFSDALAARNFDDSILRSMSGGVIALDLDFKITKLNTAAAQILGASATLLGGLDARALLHNHNPWLMPELEAVAESGEVKLLLDVELHTARERTSSVNISIAPLHGEQGPAGLLLVIEDISEGKRLQGAMRRFMTQEVVDQVLSRDDELLFGTGCTASVLFADIRNFTGMAEALSPRETVETLNELFTDLYEAVAENNGVLDKYIGDAVMAVFGAPLSSGRDPQNALAAGLEMLRRLDAVNTRRAERGAAALRIGIGISTGEVVAGTIGSPKRMDYTVIGDSVNFAARLQGLTKTYKAELVVCDRTAAAAAAVGVPLRELDLIRVRGRTQPAKIFEVLAGSLASGVVCEEALEAYRKGRERLIASDWTGAIAAFERALALEPDDGPASVMLKRARSLAAQPPGEDWDGVWQDSQ